MPQLTDYHRCHIIELLEQGKDLPPDYKHLLFPPERQEYELVYAGKEREEDILAETMAVPLQPVKTFGEAGEGEWRNKMPGSSPPIRDSTKSNTPGAKANTPSAATLIPTFSSRRATTS